MDVTSCLRLRKDVAVALRRRAIPVVVILATLFLPRYSCTAKKSNREFGVISDLLRNDNGDASTEETKAKTPMKVIGAGFGRTGTSSLLSALKTLGLKPYHFIEGVVNTPGHFDLWGEIISRSVDDFPLSKGDADAIVDRIAVDGFDATTDFPACMLYEEFHKRYPDALVVLTVRGSGEEWARSMMGTLGTIQQTSSYVPWRWFAGFRRVATFSKWWQGAIGAPVDSRTLLPDPGDLARAHDAWTERVRSTIPRKKLLIHQFSDGWKPLCDFLVPVLDEEAKQKCARMVADNEPYPSVNSNGELQRMVLFLRTMPWILKGLASLLIFVVLLRRLRRRRQRTKPSQGPNKED